MSRISTRVMTWHKCVSQIRCLSPGTDKNRVRYLFLLSSALCKRFTGPVHFFLPEPAVLCQGEGERERERERESFELTMKLTWAQGCQVFSTFE